MELDATLEAVLFFKGEAVSIKKLSQILEKNPAEIQDGLRVLEEKLKTRGIRLLRIGDEVALGTASKADEIIEKLTKEELSRDIGRAGLETLSIIIYRGPIARREIDYIRGVNSTFILRNLLIRGLVEKVQAEKDQRSFLYKPTLELLSHLGLEKIEDLPEYTRVKEEIKKFEESEKQTEEGENGTH
ncbi:MAG: SMC-Scp complex subunit ScpB [Candidatus Pacebacteria bacterium]|nr:SMC-Scp complex subunit ScpB [Candidatus Paceibacterota bacterium]